MLYLVKLSFRNEDKINISTNKQKLKKFVTSPILQETLKTFLKLKWKDFINILKNIPVCKTHQ